MSIPRMTGISATSTKSFEDAVQQGIKRATKTLRNVTSAWIKTPRVAVADGGIRSSQVKMMVIFVPDG